MGATDLKPCQHCGHDCGPFHVGEGVVSVPASSRNEIVLNFRKGIACGHVGYDNAEFEILQVLSSGDIEVNFPTGGEDSLTVTFRLADLMLAANAIRSGSHNRRMREFVRVSDHAALILKSSGTWAGRYDAIFSDGVSRRLSALGMREYCDPDMGYEDDVRAFVSAATEQADEYRVILEKTT